MASGKEHEGGGDASSERFRKLVAAAPDGIVISRDGIVVYANPAAVKLLGYDSPAELEGHPMTFLSSGELGKMRARIGEMQATGARLPPLEYEAHRKDGAPITVEIASILVDFEGAPAVLAFARDVTDRARLRAQLAHADRLAALGVIAAGVAHEINNPLAFMTLAADLLARRIPEDDAHMKRSIGDIRAGLRRIGAIVRDLRVYGRYEEEQIGAVDLANVLDTAERIVAQELKPRATLTRDQGALPRVQGIATRLEQVFVNLLLNAAFVFPEGERRGTITVRARHAGDEVVVDVIDDGAGMAPELLERIFEPFFTARPSRSGTGLGLSVCRDIVFRAGGSLLATSESGRGTTMRVTLRVAPPERVTAPPSRPVEGARPGSGRRVLVVDDEPRIVDLVKETLDGEVEVIGETDATSALERMLGDPPFDVIVCDLMMSGVSGMEIHERIARERPGFEDRIVFVTAGPYTPRAREFFDRVTNVKLGKPFSASELRSAIRGALRRC